MTRVQSLIGVAVLQAVLRAIGVLLVLSSRRRTRLRRQLTRDMLIEIRSEDGARQQYRVVAAARRIEMPARFDGAGEVVLVFPTAWHGLRVLLSRNRVGHIVEGMNYGETRIIGNPALVLWFHGLTRVVLPLGTSRRPRRGRRDQLPARRPETELPYARWIRREPPVAALSQDWPEAWAARAKLLQIRATRGERLPPG